MDALATHDDVPSSHEAVPAPQDTAAATVELRITGDHRIEVVDLTTLQENPFNPRRTAADQESDATLTAGIKAHGILQPITVSSRTEPHTIIFGSRRRRCGVAAGLTDYPVIVRDIDPSDTAAIALIENLQRTPMNAVDTWRHISKMLSGKAGQQYTEEGAALELCMTVRDIRRFMLLGHVHPKMLDRMAVGDSPSNNELRIIAMASKNDQESVWKKHRPQKGETHTSWTVIANALKKRRMPAEMAAFGEDLAAKYNVKWEDDLFVPAGVDGRTTTNVEGFLGAQHEHMVNTLPEKGQALAVDEIGHPALPRFGKAVSRDGEDVKIGRYVDPMTGEIKEISFVIDEPVKKSATQVTTGTGGAGAAGNGANAKGPTRGTGTVTPIHGKEGPSQPDISARGKALIGTMRTGALHDAFLKNEITDTQLLGLLVLALGSANVTIRTAEMKSRDKIGTLAQQLMQGQTLSTDEAVIRSAAREVLAMTYSCEENETRSGDTARVAGIVIGANDHLPTMATEEFLATLSKPAVTAVAKMNKVKAAPTAKETRDNMVKAFKGRVFVYPDALFGFGSNEAERPQAPTPDAETPAGEASTSFEADRVATVTAEEEAASSPSDSILTDAA